MSFTLTCFADLVAKYDSWDSLRTFLTSDEGGKLRVIEPVAKALGQSQDANADNVIIRYTKDVSNFSLSYVPAFRSVVWNKKTNRPVCVAPVKAHEITEISSGCEVRVMDFVDGTMINAWKSNDGDPTSWSELVSNESSKIASRSSLGANCKFYSERSFADLFDDALTASVALGQGQGQSQGQSQSQAQTQGKSQVTKAFLDSVLKVGEFASFVLQHKEHKTVSPIPYNRIYVTYFGKIDEKGVVSMSCTEMPERLASYLPEVFDANLVLPNPDEGSKTMHTMVRGACGGRGYYWQGLVFQDTTTSRRYRLRNPEYTIVRALRGSESNLMERFLRLRTAGKTKQYLSYFREESAQMWELEQALRTRTTDLYTAYIEMNKLKQKGMRDLPYCLRPHVYALHGLYLKSVKTGAKSIIKDTVIGYVNALAVEDQLRLLSAKLTVPPVPAPVPVEAEAEQVPVA